MSNQKVIVLAVTVHGLSKAEEARRNGVSRQWVHELLKRFASRGMDAFEPRSRRPNGNPRSIPETLAGRILALRQELEAAGLDCGPLTLAWHLDREGLAVPSISTIRRILHTAGLIRPEPKKRPKAKRPCTASRPTSPTKTGSPTSPTGSWPTEPTPRS
jgi:transposase